MASNPHPGAELAPPWENALFCAVNAGERAPVGRGQEKLGLMANSDVQH